MVLRGCAHSADKSLGRLFKGGGVQGQSPCRVWAEPNAACANKKTPSVPLDGEAQGAVPLSCFTQRASIAAHAEGAAPPAPGRTFPTAPRGPLSASGSPSLPDCHGYSFRSSRFSSPLYYQQQRLGSRRFQKRCGGAEGKRRRGGSGQPCGVLENFGTEQPDAEKILAGSGWYVFRNMTDESD